MLDQFCGSLAGNTNCNGGSLPGLEEFVYEGNFIRFCYYSAGCTSNSITGQLDICCRDDDVTNYNIPNSSSQEFWIETTFDPSTLNNSVSFNSPPVLVILH